MGFADQAVQGPFVEGVVGDYTVNVASPFSITPVVGIVAPAQSVVTVDASYSAGDITFKVGPW